MVRIKPNVYILPYLITNLDYDTNAEYYKIYASKAELAQEPLSRKIPLVDLIRDNSKLKPTNYSLDAT